MSEPANEQSNNDPNLGYSTRTDVGGARGTQGDVRTDERSIVEPRPADAGTPSTEPTSEPQTENAPADAGQPLGDSAPQLADLQNQLCPNCHTGVLYVTRYDPNAVHEHEQGEALASGKESGGAYDVQCHYCAFSESRAFNPGKRFGR